MNNAQIHISNTRRFAVLFMAAAALMLVPEAAFASPGAVLCSIANLAQNDLGRGIASLAIISIGIGAAFGRASWTQAVLVCVGIAVIKSAGWAASTFGLITCPGMT